MATAQVNVNLEFKIAGVTVPMSASALPAYTESSAGDIGIPDEAADETEYEIPFSTVAAACVLFILNNNTVDVGVRLNGAADDEFQIAPGSFLLIVQKVAAGAVPISSATVTTTGIQDGAATVSYAVLGT